jgi:hypothetical protein
LILLALDLSLFWLVLRLERLLERLGEYHRAPMKTHIPGYESGPLFSCGLVVFSMPSVSLGYGFGLGYRLLSFLGFWVFCFSGFSSLAWGLVSPLLLPSGLGFFLPGPVTGLAWSVFFLSGLAWRGFVRLANSHCTESIPLCCLIGFVVWLGLSSWPWGWAVRFGGRASGLGFVHFLNN